MNQQSSILDPTSSVQTVSRVLNLHPSRFALAAKNLRKGAVLILSLMCLSGCSSNVASGGIAYNTIDIQNAIILAQCLTGDLRAPEGLSRSIAEDLALIRSHLGVDHPEIIDVTKRPAWGSSLEIHFTREVFGDVQGERYSAWDDTNAQFDVSQITMIPGVSGARLLFGSGINLCAVAEVYSNLRGVIAVYQESTYGVESDVGIAEIPDGRAYLFYRGFGGCQAGCMDREFRLVNVVGPVVTLAGIYQRGELPIPEWWSEALVLFEDPCECSPIIFD